MFFALELNGRNKKYEKNRRIMQKKLWIFSAYTNYAFML
jgi:hypothetical protein